MSSSRQFSESRAIPTRTVLINDTTQLPHDYCTTPGGTLFSTTPGGKGSARLLCLFIKKMQHYCLFVVFALLCRPVSVHVTVAYRLPCHPDQNKNKDKPRPLGSIAAV